MDRPHRPQHRCPRHSQRGQGMTEYLIVVALIAVAAIGVFSLLGQTLRSQTAGLAMEISGQSSSSAVSAAQGAAGSAQSAASQRKSLSNYGQDNQ